MLPLTQSKTPVAVCRRASMNSSIGWGTRLKEAWREISAVLHIRTFQIIILQVWLTSHSIIHNPLEHATLRTISFVHVSSVWHILQCRKSWSVAGTTSFKHEGCSNDGCLVCLSVSLMLFLYCSLGDNEIIMYVICDVWTVASGQKVKGF